MPDSLHSPELLEILARLDAIEVLLERVAKTDAPPEGDWVDSETFCRLVNLKNTKALTYQMSKGLFDNSAVKNIGTEKRPKYRFHRTRATAQFLNRS